jgi:triacylglycerol lipase
LVTKFHSTGSFAAHGAHAAELAAFAPAQSTAGGRVMVARALETIAISADLKDARCLRSRTGSGSANNRALASAAKGVGCRSCNFRMHPAQEGTMSFLVKLPIEHYARDAFAQFADRPAFDIGNARAMAWMCQLAYETDEPDKIAKILTDRGFTLFDGGVLIREAKTVLPMADTHCFLARHNQTGITIVAFAGTDPLSLANWVSDFNARPDKKTGAAEGYQGAADAVTNDLLQLLARSVPQDGKLIVTGHSLGGAIAALIAARIEKEHRSVKAVYTYRMPRPGDQGLVDSYNAAGLGMRTYRMVHGHDIVATVAPSSFGFLHLGRVLTCERLAKFVAANLAADTSSDVPQFDGDDFSQSVRDHLNGVFGQAERLSLNAMLRIGANPSGLRTDLAGILIEMLPPRLRDHMPDRYIAACTA